MEERKFFPKDSFNHNIDLYLSANGSDALTLIHGRQLIPMSHPYSPTARRVTILPSHGGGWGRGGQRERMGGGGLEEKASWNINAKGKSEVPSQFKKPFAILTHLGSVIVR